MKRLVALGMLRRGDVASPAAVVISSGEKMKEKPDLIKAVQKPRKRPVAPPTRYGLKAPG